MCFKGCTVVMAKAAQGPRNCRIWPWLVLALATLPAIWYVVDFESDIDPEFPLVARPTFNTYPPAAYRFAEPGDTIDHIAVYVAAAAIVLSGWGVSKALGHASGTRRWPFPWPATGTHRLPGRFWTAGTAWAGERSSTRPCPGRSAWSSRPRQFCLLVIILWGSARGRLVLCGYRARQRSCRFDQRGCGSVLVRQFGWVDPEPLGFWPRWIYVWGLLAWALALLRVLPRHVAVWSRRVIVAGLVSLWLGLDFTGRGILWHQRPLHRLREVVPGRIYLSAMPTYQGLVLAQERHHFRTIVNLFPEDTSGRSSPLARRDPLRPRAWFELRRQ